MLTRLVGTAAAVLLGAALTAALPGPGYAAVQGGGAPAAAGCSGHRCDGKDPLATGCDTSAVTVDSADMGSGIAELRWSPTCRTNWVRVRNFGGGTFLRLSVTERATGHTASISVPPTAGNHWGDMVYAPGCATGFADSSSFYAHLESSDC